MNRKIPWFRLLYLICLLMGLLLSWTTHPQTRVWARSVAQDGRVVYVLTFEGPVTPVLEQYIVDNIEEAQLNGVDALILELDTPGGSVDVTKSITQKMLASSIPIIVYVAPLGAHAGSAGTFITLAGHAAAMAPGSGIGAASPISSSGQDIGETLEAKVENMLSADIENLASRRGDEAVEWAIAAVREAEAATAEQALELGVIDAIAQDIPDLLMQLDGFEVNVQGEAQPLEIRDAFVVAQELNPIQRFLHFIADPTIASLLFSLGSLGLILELRSPGFGVPGIVGFVCLLLAFYALGQLEANFTGLALIGLSLVLFAAELFTPTFGVLAVGGIISFILGAILLFDTPGIQVPWVAVVTLAIGLGAFSFFAGSMGLVAQRRRAKTGGDDLIGRTGTARQTFRTGERGDIFVYGEWWKAKLDGTIADSTVNEGAEVEIVDRDGYTLVVRPVG